MVRWQLWLLKNNSAKIDGTKEAEVTINDFDEMDRILTKIGLKARNYQENRRHQFKYKDTEIDIDTWPLIPTYVEIEGSHNNSREIDILVWD